MDFIFLAIVLNLLLCQKLPEVFSLADPRHQGPQVRQNPLPLCTHSAIAADHKYWRLQQFCHPGKGLEVRGWIGERSPPGLQVYLNKTTDTAVNRGGLYCRS